MDKDDQNEVTSRLRSAIKKKLSEISDIVDDELPEYIMILVANQRSKSQIEKDLSLFLRDDTVNFTNWLWNLLNNINIGSKPDSSKVKNEASVPKKKENDEDAVVLDYYLDEQENELLSHEDTNDSLSVKAVPQAKESSHSIKKSVKVEKDPLSGTKTLKREITPDQKVEKTEKPIPGPESKRDKNPVKRGTREQPCSKVVPVKRRCTNSDDEYDPSKPEYNKPARSRNYGGSAAFQANKLLLRAVDDAAKSILDGKNMEEFYKPTPIKILSSRQAPLSKKEVNYVDKHSFQGAANPVIATSHISVDPEYLDVDLRQLNQTISTGKNRMICIENSPDSRGHDQELETEDVPKSPHFIVTMEGINMSSFKRRLDHNSIESTEDEEMEFEETSQQASPVKKLKVSERCKYWPACKNSDSCMYHHPSTPCKCFPDCKFGDKCLYIHPNCKFDALCSRKDCPFTHASRRKLPLTTLPVKMIPVKPVRAKIVCKYFPNCTARSCPFIHPKICRYGAECRSPSCMFSHLPIPARSQLKWQASDLSI